VSRRRFASSFLLAFAASAVAASAGAQSPAGGMPPGESELKAAFVYNFLKFVEWPSSSFGRSTAPLVVAVVGDGPTADATARFLAAKQVGARPVAVRRVAWDDSFAGVHAVFVAETDDSRRKRIFSAASDAAVLSIGEGADFAASGGVIALVIDDRKVRFDIDVGAARSSGLKVSSKLLALTRVVHAGQGGTEGGR
jgi:hypothetical protein